MRTLALLLFLVSPAWGEDLVAALSQNTVSITASFSGSEIWVFGAVARTAPVPEEAGPAHVVLAVSGPEQRLTVRRKARVLGIWVNRDAVAVDAVPSFYAVATTGPLRAIVSEAERLRYGIGYDQAVRIADVPAGVENPESFAEAVVRIREGNGLYIEAEGAVLLTAETLFNARIQLPANLVEGVYTARMFLVRDSRVVSETQARIDVRKAGLERFIYRLAQDRPLLYGLMSIAVALVAGWLASEMFRLLRR